MRLLTCWLWLLFWSFASAARAQQTKQKQRPHIVVIMADDLGWSDVSFHGTPQIPTPNIDALASDGVILDNHYVQPMCSPSRAAFLTGLYPIRTGMQHHVIRNAEPWGLPLKVKILPQYLKELGYDTHAIGKWHLGNHMRAYAPTNRGFDTFYGYFLGFGDYYNHTLPMGQEVGYDFFDGVEPVPNATGKYATDLFTERAVSIIDNHNKSNPMFMYLCHMAPHSGPDSQPFQAPQENIDKFRYIENKNRTTYAAMLDKLDESVGIVVEALQRNDMMNNTILLFLSDNGGKPWGKMSNYAFNWPLRGMKETLWEGGVRSSSFLWSPLLEQAPRISDQMIHITDWLPTLYGAAGGSRRNLGKLDGFMMWRQLSRKLISPRIEILLNYDNIDKTSSLRFSKYKLMKGHSWYGPKDEWYRVPGQCVDGCGLNLDAVMMNSTVAKVLRKFYNRDQLRFQKNWRRKLVVNCKYEKPFFNSLKGPFLFDLEDDPCEMQDISSSRKRLLRILSERLANYERQAVPPGNLPRDPKGFPKHNKGSWSFWKDEL